MIIARNITNSVPTAVWIATLIKTYQNFILDKNDNYWINQKDIQEIAKLLCPKNIDNARISQWCNGDHPNNTYNYLRSKGSLRRLTKIGEFSNQKEQPRELPINELIFDNNVELLNIIEWYKNVYCKIEFEDPKEIVHNNQNRNSDVNNKVPNKYEQDSYRTSEMQSYKNSFYEELYENQNINIRTISLIKVAWEIFSKKVGNGLILINKEASMQLQYAYILKSMLPLIIFRDDEFIEIELETTISDGKSTREVDIMVIVSKGVSVYKIALELKCYKTKASSGGNRGATDIFMKDVYQDVHLLERYCENNEADIGIALVMNDYKNFVFPKKKSYKCWDYDISQGAKIGRIHLNTPIGGKQVDILLNNEYDIKWNNVGEFWFLLLMTK
ncbi:hypothetical protein [Clostridium cellulovorans]|uniref:Uncharacterized protein n=1 Tax=Clostridium cellulovorans (strain ATCC 35296 / DSM 3052 / OCM 3 / 743B) TaxID=573061 RepID=D9SP77_CLOC7|nr:hypothetical protein [Clostridium cellulovorans]ADL52042.1 hypothetical protein Clocel_2323 [Clostridium cellulovorans 743B]